MSTGEQPYKIASIILLVLVLIISWSSLSAIRSVRQQVQSMQGELHNLRSQVTHEVGSIRGTVQSIRDEARWYTAPRFEVTGTEDTIAMIRLSWNLQEYTEGSIVTLNYRYADQAAFTGIDANEESSGLFAVEFPIEIMMEPNLSFSVSKASGSDTRTSRNQSVAVVEEEWGPGSSPMLLQYYITLQDGEKIRTSEQYTMELDKLSYNYFNPLHLSINWEGDEKMDVVLTQFPNIPTPHYTIRDIHLESRRGRTEVIERWSFTEINVRYPQTAPEHAAFEASVVPGREYDSLFVVVEYSGGVTVEKEIPDIY